MRNSALLHRWTRNLSGALHHGADGRGRALQRKPSAVLTGVASGLSVIRVVEMATKVGDVV